MSIALGPWTGEFGFEIMAWQANCRQRASGHDRVIVGCPRSSRPLYDDFATEFWDVPFDPNTSGAHRCDGSDKIIMSQFGTKYYGIEHVPGRVFKPAKATWFRQYGHRHRGAAYTALLHARHMKKGKGDADLRRSAPQDWWDKLGTMILDAFGENVASIGLKGQALHVADTHDMRGVDLSVLMDMMQSSGLVIGPSSGPIHLAALCACPQVCWTDTTHRSGYDGLTNEDHLKRSWNPFRVPVQLIHCDGRHYPYWMPDYETIADAMKELHEQAGDDVDAYEGQDPLGAGSVQ